jgi:hypothetical protein
MTKPRNRALADIVRAGDAALCLSSFDALAGLQINFSDPTSSRPNAIALLVKLGNPLAALRAYMSIYAGSHRARGIVEAEEFAIRLLSAMSFRTCPFTWPQTIRSPLRATMVIARPR